MLPLLFLPWTIKKHRQEQSPILHMQKDTQQIIEKHKTSNGWLLTMVLTI